jgi:hypothetical protein
MMAIPGQHPKPCYRRSDVTGGFIPISIIDEMGRRVTQYRCSKRIQTLTGEIRQCCWVRRQMGGTAHQKHNFTLRANDGPFVHEVPSQSPNRRKRNKQIISIATEFISTTNLSFRQIGASRPREELLRIVEIASLVDRITDATMAEAIRQGADQRFAQAMEQLGDVHFVNLIVDAGTVDQLKSKPSLLSNPHASEQPVFLVLRENRNFTVQDYYQRFRKLMAIVDSSGMVLCSIAVDNLLVQVSGLERVLQMSGSPAIHLKCFAQMANLVLASTVSTPNFSPIMNYLADLQKLVRSPLATAQLGIKCP